MALRRETLWGRRKKSFNPHTKVHPHSIFTLAMFSKLALIVASACALAAVAAPTANGGSSCGASNGSLQCCASTQSSNSPSSVVSGLLAGLGVNLSSVTGEIGLSCTSLVGGASCSQQAACCSGNNYYGGLIVLSCSPINIGL